MSRTPDTTLPSPNYWVRLVNSPRALWAMFVRAFWFASFGIVLAWLLDLAGLMSVTELQVGLAAAAGCLLGAASVVIQTWPSQR